MTTAIAWGTSGYGGGRPLTGPFISGNQGSVDSFSVGNARFYFGLVGGVSDGIVTVNHTYAPAGGGDEYTVRTIYLAAIGVYGPSYWPSGDIQVVYGQDNGIHRLTASVDGVPLPTVLVLATTPDGNPYNNWYGAAAWYEEAAAPLVFWTRFINSKEVTE